MKRTFSIISFLLTSFLIFNSSSCDLDNDHPVPLVLVDFNIDVTTTQYINLNYIGGWEYVKGGYKGLVIYRKSLDEFVVFDRTCTYDPLDECSRIEVEESGLFMVDSCCMSRFLILDGSTTGDGPATIWLKQYRTQFDGQFLRVYN